MNILIYNHVFLWQNQSIVSQALAERFKKHKIFFLTCDRFLFSCPANSNKKREICFKCIIEKKNFFDQLNKEIEFNELILSKNEIHNNHYFNFENFFELKEIYYKNMPIGELVISQMCDDEKSDFLDEEFINDNKDKIIKNIYSGINLFEKTLSNINQNKIQKIYAWNGRRPSDGPVIYAAKYKNIQFKTYISSAPQRYYLSRGTKIHDQGKIKKNINNFIKYSSKKKLDVKKITKDYISNKMLGKLKKNNYGHTNFIKKPTFTKPIIDDYVVFFTSSGYEIAGFSDWESKIYLDQYDAMKKIINDQRLKKIKLIIRWHPLLINAGKIEKKRIQEIIDIKSLNTTHIKFDESDNSYDYVKYAKKVITFGSTIAFEASYFRKAIINLTKTPYDDLNFMYNPKSHDEVVELIKEEIQPKENNLTHFYYFLEKNDIYSFKIKNFDLVKNKLVNKLNLINKLKFYFFKIFYV